MRGNAFRLGRLLLSHDGRVPTDARLKVEAASVRGATYEDDDLGTPPPVTRFNAGGWQLVVMGRGYTAAWIGAPMPPSLRMVRLRLARRPRLRWLVPL